MKISTPYWTAVVPEVWRYQLDENPVLLEGPEQIGALQISVAFKDDFVEDDDLRDFAKEHLEAGAIPQDFVSDTMRGFSLSFNIDGTYWRHWYLRSTRMMVYGTYNCEDVDRHTETASVDAIFVSITPRGEFAS